MGLINSNISVKSLGNGQEITYHFFSESEGNRQDPEAFKKDCTNYANILIYDNKVVKKHNIQDFSKLSVLSGAVKNAELSNRSNIFIEEREAELENHIEGISTRIDATFKKYLNNNLSEENKLLIPEILSMFSPKALTAAYAPVDKYFFEKYSVMLQDPKATHRCWLEIKEKCVLIRVDSTTEYGSFFKNNERYPLSTPTKVHVMATYTLAVEDEAQTTDDDLEIVNRVGRTTTASIKFTVEHGKR